MKEARSGINLESLQEILDASSSERHALRKGAAQYFTPDWLARACTALLPWSYSTSILDMQCGDGELLRHIDGHRFGIEIDNRAKKSWTEEDCIDGITASCVNAMETLDEIDDTAHWSIIVANPPFGLTWQQKDGTSVDSTQWTWNRIGKHLANMGAGYMIGFADTIERLGIHKHAWVYCYNRMPAAGIWDNVRGDIGIVHFHRVNQNKPLFRVWPTTPSEHELTMMVENTELKTQSYMRPMYVTPLQGWKKLREILEDEKKDRPEYNIYLGKDGLLRTYLSIREKYLVADDHAR